MYLCRCISAEEDDVEGPCLRHLLRGPWVVPGCEQVCFLQSIDERDGYNAECRLFSLHGTVVLYIVCSLSSLSSPSLAEYAVLDSRMELLAQDTYSRMMRCRKLCLCSPPLTRNVEQESFCDRECKAAAQTLKRDVDHKIMCDCNLCKDVQAKTDVVDKDKPKTKKFKGAEEI